MRLGWFNNIRPGLYANVDQSPLSGRGHVTPVDQSGRILLNPPNHTTLLDRCCVGEMVGRRERKAQMATALRRSVRGDLRVRFVAEQIRRRAGDQLSRTVSSRRTVSSACRTSLLRTGRRHLCQVVSDSYTTVERKRKKGKEAYLYSAFYILRISQSAKAWITKFYLQIHHACLSFVCVHQMAPPLTEVRNI